MRLLNGKYQCVLCGAEIEISPEQHPLALIKAASGEPNVRVIMLEGVELHRCPVDPFGRANRNRARPAPRGDHARQRAS